MAGPAEKPLMLDEASMHHGNGAINVNAMDGTMSLDDVDLFGDPVIGNALNLPHRTLVPLASTKLQQRVDEMRSRGCCQKIAWSKQGTVATISKDGKSLDFQFLRCHPKSGNWELCEATPCSLFTQNFAGGPIMHIAWAGTGSPELAVIDASGRLSILSFSITLNRPYQMRRWDTDAVDDRNAVVGCYWLPLMLNSRAYYAMHGPAVWVADRNAYTYENSRIPASGPFHPNSAKSALFLVTANGELKLYFSQHNNRIDDMKLELDAVASSDDLITHAAITSDRNQLLLVVATASKQLRVLRVAVKWNVPNAGDKQQAPPGGVPLAPTLRAAHVAVKSWFTHQSSESHLHASMSQLSHLEVLPSILSTQTPSRPHASNNQAAVPPLIVAVRHHMPSDDSPYNQEIQSIVDCWQVVFDGEQALFPEFSQLGSKSGLGSRPANASYLKKQQTLLFANLVVGIHTAHLGKVVCFSFGDGTMQYRDRVSLTESCNGPDLGRVMSLHHAGLAFTDPSPCLQVAFSPTSASFVQLCEDWKVKWNCVRYPVHHVDLLVQGSQQYAAIKAGLCVAFSSAAVNQMMCDDILAVAKLFAQRRGFDHDWLREIITMLKMPVDYLDESHHDQLVRNTHLQLCLSALNHLGFWGESRPRTFTGKLTMITLNVRNIVILITIASNTPIGLKERLSPLDEPEVVDALAGCAKWALDLLSWLIDSLFQLGKDLDFMAMLSDHQRFPEMAQYLQDRNEISLHLLLCSSTRGFILALCRRLNHLDQLSNRSIGYYENKSPQRQQPPALYHAYRRMQQFTGGSLIKVNDFEKLIMQLGQDVKSVYQTTLLAQIAQEQSQSPSSSTESLKKAQGQIELDMLLGALPPPVFRDILFHFFDNSLVKYRQQTDPACLYFADYSLLEVDDPPKSNHFKHYRRRHVDTFKRVFMGPPPPASLVASGHNPHPAGPHDNNDSGNHNNDGGGSGRSEGLAPQWRRCVRCASLMKDVYGIRPGFTFVLAQQRKCACGGNWGLLRRGSLIG